MRPTTVLDAPLRSLPLLPLLGIAAAVALFAALAWPFAPHTVDDAWITFRYSRQWTLGVGPYWNPGEHVEGYSNFLLMLLLTPVIALGGEGAALPAAKAIGLASGLLAVAGAGQLARRVVGDRPWGWAAGVAAAGLVAAAPGFAYHAMSGLETSLFACLLTWGVLGLGGRGRAVIAGGVALAAAAITRPEGPLLFAVCWLVTAATRPAPERHGPAAPSRWPPLLVAGAIGAIAILGQVAFRYATYDGEWVTNTYWAKTGGSGEPWHYVADVLSGAFLGGLPLLLGVAGALLCRAPRAWWLAAVPGILGALLPLVTGGDWMPGGRLVMPYVPLLAAATAAGIGLAGAARGRARTATVLLLVLVPAALVVSAAKRRELRDSAAVETVGARTGHGALAAWLGERAKPGEAVVLMDIGQIGYRLIEQRLVDVTGLTDRHIAKSPGAFMAKRFDLAYVFDQRPAWIVLTFFGRGDPLAPFDPTAPLYPFNEMESRLASHPAFARDYYREPDPGAPPVDGLERLRQGLGAVAVFPYATPGRRYLLAVYRRRG